MNILRTFKEMQKTAKNCKMPADKKSIQSYCTQERNYWNKSKTGGFEQDNGKTYR